MNTTPRKPRSRDDDVPGWMSLPSEHPDGVRRRVWCVRPGAAVASSAMDPA